MSESLSTPLHRPLHQVSVRTLKGVGAALETKLAKLGIANLQDLLFHLPLRYQDRTRISPLNSIHFAEDVVIEGNVTTSNIVMGRRRSLVCRVDDGTGSVTLRFFHFSAGQKHALASGTRLRCFGEVRRGAHGLELFHPEYQTLRAGDESPLEQSLTPIYPTTEGLNQQRLRSLCGQALAHLQHAGSLQELLPQDLAPNTSLSLHKAIRFLHEPPANADIAQVLAGQHPAQQRLAFEELLAHQISLLQLRHKARECASPRLRGEGQLRQQFLAGLGFTPTSAQSRVGAEIAEDLKQAVAMLRLVQGDVGSGKTLVAAMAMLQAVESGYQACLMAPTEILAEQHYLNFKAWLEPLGLKVAWLMGKLKGKARAEQLALISSGEAQVIIGTHALFQDEVSFSNLALAVIDEQHRFGVHQRLALRDKGAHGSVQPHQLIMTATPIPRTLAMSAYADLDVSIIDELPPGRTPVNTVVIGDERRLEVIDRVRAACAAGRQAYWVCTLIDESEALQCQAAEAACELLREQLKGVSIALVHGRLKPAEKVEIMRAFKAGDIQLLVATTVIEVGVDVPNASLMIIENPERLGLAQLHQLRGRVGRGAQASHCVLLYHPPLSQHGRERLSCLRDSNDGFVIAEKDLQLRGPGEVLGVRQTGLVDFRIADLQRDGWMLDGLKQAAARLESEHASACEPLIKRWLGDRSLYAQV